MSAVLKESVSDRARRAGKQPRRHSEQIYESLRRAHARALASGAAIQASVLDQPSVLATLALTARTAMPAVLASATLYFTARAYGVAFGEFFSALTVLITVLAIFLFQSPNPAGELMLSRGVIAVRLLSRWASLLGALLLISVATGFSGQYLSLYPPRVMITWAIVTPLLLLASTWLLLGLARIAIRAQKRRRNAVFVGYNETSRYLAEQFGEHADLCVSVQGVFDDRSAQRLSLPASLKSLGALADLPAYIRANRTDVIFMSLPLRHIPRVRAVLDALGDSTVSLYYVPDVFVSEMFGARSGEVLGVPVVAMLDTPFVGHRRLAKRLLDIVVASAALIVLAPVLLLVAAAIKLTSPGPIVFKQRRYGLDGEEIVIYKFRTMHVRQDGEWMAQAQPDDPRVTTLGKWLRRWSLDEFPQLINVLQGRMSLVGPRPHAVAHNEEYRRLIRGYMTRHKVPPGITGLAQVKGYRGATPRLHDMQARVHYDLEYLRNWSLLLDLKILLLTIPKLIQTDKAF